MCPPGLLGLLGLFIYDWRVTGSVNYILILVLLYAWPRVYRTLVGLDRKNEYYRIGAAATWTMGIAYVGLAVVLAFFVWRTGVESGMMGLFH